MTLVHVRLRVPTATGEGPAVGAMWATPSLRRHLESPDRVVLPASLGPVELVDGECDLELAPTGADWCWIIREGVTGGIIRYVLVPDQPTVDYGDLVDVDPTSLDPATPPSPAWVSQLAAEAAAREAADVALGERIDTAGAVQSVNGQTGAVVLSHSQVTAPNGDPDVQHLTAAQVAKLGSLDQVLGITVGQGRDYPTIQEAIDHANDSASRPATIYVYPGTYPRFSMVGSPYVSTGTNVILCRHISIIGVNATPGDVIVRDDSGDYRTPPAEISTVGTVENILFLATHDQPFSDPVEEARSRRSYAVHMEFGPQDVTFRNCDFVSMHAPGVGLGMYSGENVRFRDCRITSFADGSYGGLKDYGGLFAHSSIYDNVINQHIDLENTEISCPQGNKAIWLSVAGNFVGCDMSVRAVGVRAYAATATTVVRDSRISLTPDSGGNNSPALTPQPESTRLLGVRLPGTPVDYLMTPNPNPGVTGDIDLVWHGALDAWASGAFQGLVASYSTTTNNRSWGLSVSPIGRLYLTWTTDGLGSSLKTATSTSPVVAENGAHIWVRATLDVDNGIGGSTATFYTSSDGVTWSPLGKPVVGIGATSIYAGTAPITVGLWATYPATGVMSRAIVRSGINGELVADWDGSISTPQRDSRMNWWTVVGPAYSVVASPDSSEVGLTPITDPRLSDARTPLAHEHTASDVTSGTLATARLGTGTADATTYLRGDQTWAAPLMLSDMYHHTSVLPSGMRVVLGDVGRVSWSENYNIGFSDGAGGDDGSLFALPFVQQDALEFSSWAIKASNTNPCNFRWGIFAPRVSGFGPGTLIWQSSMLASSTATHQVVSESFTLPSGIFWVGWTSSLNFRAYGVITNRLTANQSLTGVGVSTQVYAYSVAGKTWATVGFEDMTAIAPIMAKGTGCTLPAIVGLVA